jgi:hypothetical protein
MIIITYKKILHHPGKLTPRPIVTDYSNYRYPITLADGTILNTIIQLSNDKGIAYDWAWLKESTNPLTQLREWDE